MSGFVTVACFVVVAAFTFSVISPPIRKRANRHVGSRVVWAYLGFCVAFAFAVAFVVAVIVTSVLSVAVQS